MSIKPTGNLVRRSVKKKKRWPLLKYTSNIRVVNSWMEL